MFCVSYLLYVMHNAFFYLLLNKPFPDYYALTWLQPAIPTNILAHTHIIQSCIEDKELLFSTDSNSDLIMKAYLQCQVMTLAPRVN
jgi:hypothetical protein